MLDPSILLNPRGLIWIERNREESMSLTVAASLHGLLERTAGAELIHGADGRALSFIGGARPVYDQRRGDTPGQPIGYQPRVDLNRVLLAVRSLEPYEAGQGPIEHRNQSLAPILNDEFMFLTTQSWVASRIFAPFECLFSPEQLFCSSDSKVGRRSHDEHSN